MHANYKTKFPNQPGQIATNLIQLPDRIGNYTHIAGQCSERWGVDCGENFKGVTPLSPEVSTQTLIPGKQPFPEIDSLTPRFSWKPAGKQGVSYDLIIYEAATYSYTGTDDGIMQGRMVLYEEGIKSPSFQLKMPLKEKTKYYWSVRLREGNVISPWSTYSHFGFYVFYMTSGYGQWFTFSTP